MRILFGVALASLFFGVTLIANAVIASWWDRSVGVAPGEARIPVEGIALVVIGTLVALFTRPRPSDPRDDRPRPPVEPAYRPETEISAKAERVVLYEHGPDERPY
ncbi:hypothetical protein [Amorphus orientalis]|uniref:Uncharacterized protein n=1 Tax=Amorphus orientalis TaxID=649198 RepID=A0AAE3VQA3_9HYPH|nr:hypothetical protein [Amorphus orientalis]MDQ0316324.1 hypothetical protein [Amorphus orientalis]